MDNREKILESALDLFYTKGYDAVGVQEIVDRAGVTKPTLYHYFGSKYGLLECLTKEYFDRFEAQMTEASQYMGDLPLTLYRFVKTCFNLTAYDARFCRFFMSMLYSAEETDTYKVVKPFADKQLALLTSVFLEAGNVIGNMNGRQEQYALTLIGMIYSSLLFWSLRNDEQFINDEKVFKLVHQFLHGIYV